MDLHEAIFQLLFQLYVPDRWRVFKVVIAYPQKFFFFFQTNQRYEDDDIKRAEYASKDARFSALLAIGFGIAIALFFIFIEKIVPTFA